MDGTSGDLGFMIIMIMMVIVDPAASMDTYIAGGPEGFAISENLPINTNFRNLQNPQK